MVKRGEKDFYKHAEENWHSGKKYAFIRKSAIFTQNL